MTYVNWASNRLRFALYGAFEKAYAHHVAGYCTLEDIRETWRKGYGEDIVEYWDEWLKDGE